MSKKEHDTTDFRDLANRIIEGPKVPLESKNPACRFAVFSTDEDGEYMMMLFGIASLVRCRAYVDRTDFDLAGVVIVELSKRVVI